MTRDEMIMGMTQMVHNIAKHYGYYNDEDLEQEGMVEVIRGVDRCLSQNMEDYDEICRICNRYANYGILHELKRRNKQNVCEDFDDYEDFLVGEQEMGYLMQIDSVLGEDEKQVFYLLCGGYEKGDIARKLNMSLATVYNKINKIKEKIKNF